MQDNQIIYPNKGMDLSIDESFIPEEYARFIRGWNQFLGYNPSSTDGGNTESANSHKLTKNPSNKLFGNVSLPAGDNYCIGGGYIPETSQYFSCIWNSTNQHSIWRLDAKKKTTTLVIQNPCLNFQLNLENFISKTRFTYVTVDSYYKNSNIPAVKTWIIITDDNERVKQIPVEDCISTNGLTHEFFNTSNDCCSVCDMITLGAPGKPIGCIDITPVPRPDTPEEKTKQNYISSKVWQFRLKYIDVWGRESVHGVISDQYYNQINSSCYLSEYFMPRCIDLKFNAGCKYISDIYLEYRLCGVGNQDQLETDWVRCDIISKYSDCDLNGNYIPEFWNRDFKQKYYQPISDSNLISYNSVTNEITIRFCGNKETSAIPKTETDLNSLYIPNRAKGLFKIGNKIGISNAERGFNPLSCSQLDNIKFTLDQTVNACNPTKTYKVTVWGYIYSPLDSKLTNIRYFDSDNNGNKESVGFGQAGKNDGSYASAKDNPKYYNQYFGNGAKHFIMYAVGHDDYYVEGVQIYRQSGTNFVEIGPMSTRTSSSSYLQRWELNLPNGKYVLRLAAPYIGLNMELIDNERAYRRSSASMIGLTNHASPGLLTNEQYEIYVEVCNGDVNMWSTPLLIWDLTRDVSGVITNLANVVEGYIKNNITAYGNYGVENCDVNPSSGSASPLWKCLKTDANGHYFGTTIGGIGFGTQLRFDITDNYCTGGTYQSDISNNTDNYKLSNDIALIDKTTFVIKGQLLEQGTNYPIQGMSIVYQNGRWAISDTDGKFIIRANGLIRTDKIIFSNLIGGCVKVRTDDECSSCFDTVAISVPACNIPDKVVDIGSLYFKSPSILNTNSIFQGRYAAGIVLEDCLGMETFIQSPDNNYIEIDNSDNNNKILFDLNGLANIPSNFKYLSFYITENLTYEDWLEWIVDYAILEDNNGNIAQSGQTLQSKKRVRLYINSQILYTVYSQANTSWQFLKGDLIQIYATGGGTLVNLTKLVSYHKGQSYITIDYDDSMSNIVNNLTGAKIRILRPRISNTTEKYYQLCKYIKVVNGEPEIKTGTLNFINSYRVSRSIPYYDSVITVQPTVINKYDTEGNVISTEEVTIPVSTPTPNGSKRTYILNHNSPSDFFGSKCYGKGRINVKNKYEKIHRYSTEISVSNGISPEGNTNYLHWFTIDNTTSFDEQVYHGITAVIAEQNIILVICTNDYFTLLYNQNELKVDEQTNNIYAIPASNRFGQPRTKSGNNYGCSYQDHNTINVHNGLVWYLDSKNSQIIKHDFQNAQIFTPSGCQGWLKDKIVHVANNNNTKSPRKQKYWHGIIDPRRNQYLLTVFELDKFGISNWVNNMRTVDIQSNETICVGGSDEPILFDMPHFTPESYGIMKSEELGLQVVSFKSGIPYIHYPVGSNDCLNYYGIQCKPVLELIFNKQPSLNKNFLSITEKIKEHLLYCDRIITESGQTSYLMPWNFVKGNNQYASSFKLQINGTTDVNKPNNTNQNAIIDGQNNLYGKWIKVRLVTKDGDDSKYAELFLITILVKLMPK